MNTFKKLLLGLLATVTTIGLTLSTTACENPTLPTPPQEETPLPDDGNNTTPTPDDDDTTGGNTTPDGGGTPTPDDDKPSGGGTPTPDEDNNETPILPITHVHDWGDWTETIAPTCSSQGERQRVCKLNSNHVETETLPIREHTEADWGDWTETVAPTCSSEGERQRVCKTNSQHLDIESLPTTEEHNFTDSVWKSKDNVTMTATCQDCRQAFTKDVPDCEHFLSLNVNIDAWGAISAPGIYTCENCAVAFDPYDVLLLTFDDAEEEGYYRMTVTSKLPNVEYDYYGLFSKPLKIEIAEGSSFTYNNTWEENKRKIRELVFGENVSIVSHIDCYEYLYTLTFGEDVQKINTDATCDLFSLKEIYFEGYLPELEADALWRRNAAVEGEDYNSLAPTVYYKDGAKGFENYGYKLQGCGLRMLGEEPPLALNWTMKEYASATNARSLEMAKTLFEKSAKTRPFLQFYPFCSLSEYREIKDLAISLTQGLSTDKAKAKAIFDWIVDNITYDDAAMFYPVEKVFETKKAVCAGYAGLMHDMLAAVEIPSLYTSGISYFGTTCTVQEILSDEYQLKYEGNGHGWLICYLDGEPFICDPTWNNFAISSQDFTNLNLATTAINGITVIPEEFDPALYANLLYFDDNGELYILQNGYLSSLNGYGVNINYVFPFGYRFRASNDGYDYGFGSLDCQSAYNEAFIDYCEQGYKYYIFFGSDFREYSYVQILKFFAFEKLWYNDPFDMDFLEEFVFDDYGTIYHINEGNVLGVVGSIAESDKLVIPETVNGMKVTSIDDNALQGCYAKEIILPNTLEKIGAQAFMNCINIESIVLPESLKHIEPAAFAYCFNLKSVTMYTGVEFIGYKDNKRLSLPPFLFADIPTEQLTVYYQGTEEDFEKIYFNDPYANPENLTFDTEQYEHVKSYVTFKD